MSHQELVAGTLDVYDRRVNVHSAVIQEASDPVVDSDVATKRYVDSGKNKYDYVVPENEDVVEISASSAGVLLNPVGSLAELTLSFPVNPVQGQTVGISSSHTISSLKVVNAVFASGTPPASIGFNVALKYIWNNAANAWFPF